MPAHLVLKYDEEPSAFPLDKPIVVIGRSDDCDIVIRKTMKISRRHCCVAQVNGKLVIRDLGSMNGMKVNGERVIEEELHEGDEVQLGDLFFKFTLSSKPAGTIKKSGQKPASGKQSPTPKPSPPLDLSLDFPQMVPDEEVDAPTPVKSPGGRLPTGKSPPGKSSGSKSPAGQAQSGKSSVKPVEGKLSEAKSSGNKSAGKNSGKKPASNQAGLLDSGDLDVGGLEMD